MVRGRRDQGDPRDRVPRGGDDLVDLETHQLAALPRLGPLCDLDLQLIRVDQVLGGDPEPPGRDLLDR